MDDTTATRPRRRAVKLTLVSLVIGVLLSFLTASMASAKPTVPDPGDTGGGGNNDPHPTMCGTGSFDSNYLPLSRWTAGTETFHTRVSGGPMGLPSTTVIQRNIQSGMIQTGNFFYNLSSQMSVWSTKFCPLQKVGGVVDQATGQLGKAILKSYIGVLALVIILAGAAWSFMRSNDHTVWWRKVIPKAIIIGFLALVVVGSTQSKGGGINGDTSDYRPGPGSAGWFAVTINNLVTEIGTVPAQAMGGKAMTASLNAPDANDPLNCGNYIQSLQDQYTTSAGGLTDSNGDVLISMDGAALPPMAVSNMWQISGLNAWNIAQFGSHNSDGYRRVSCWTLERNSSMPVGKGNFKSSDNQNAVEQSQATTVDVLAHEWGLDADTVNDKIKLDAPAWHGLDNENMDRAMVAYAVCSPQGKTMGDKVKNFNNPKGWGAYTKYTKDFVQKEKFRTDAALSLGCYSFYNKAGDDVPDMFDWGDGDDNLKDSDIQPYVSDFVGTVHGTKMENATVATLAYVVSSLSVMVIMGGLSIMVILAKVVSIVMMFALILVMLRAMFPGPTVEPLKKYGKEYLGYTMLSVFGILILSIITLFTNLILNLTAAISGGPASLLTLMLGGVAPVLSAVALHMAFKRLNLPSPMTVKGGMTWSKAIAGGAAAGAVAEGAGRMWDRARGMGQGGARRAGRSAFGGIKDTLTGGRKVRDMEKKKQRDGIEARTNAQAPGIKSENGAAASMGGDGAILDDKKMTAKEKMAAMAAARTDQKEGKGLVKGQRAEKKAGRKADAEDAVMMGDASFWQRGRVAASDAGAKVGQDARRAGAAVGKLADPVRNTPLGTAAEHYGRKAGRGAKIAGGALGRGLGKAKDAASVARSGINAAAAPNGGKRASAMKALGSAKKLGAVGVLGGGAAALTLGAAFLPAAVGVAAAVGAAKVAPKAVRKVRGGIAARRVAALEDHRAATQSPEANTETHGDVTNTKTGGGDTGRKVQDESGNAPQTGGGATTEATGSKARIPDAAPQGNQAPDTGGSQASSASGQELLQPADTTPPPSAISAGGTSQRSETDPEPLKPARDETPAPAPEPVPAPAPKKTAPKRQSAKAAQDALKSNRRSAASVDRRADAQASEARRAQQQRPDAGTPSGDQGGE